MNIVSKVLSSKCPNCESGNIFKRQGNIVLLRMPKMNEKCESCSFKFEKEPGFFYGAMYISYAISVGLMIGCFILFWLILDLATIYVISIFFIVVSLLSLFNFRISRTIWIYLFYQKN